LKADLLDGLYRRRVAYFNVTAHPTADWVARQIKEAFPYDEAPRYLIRDRAGIFSLESIQYRRSSAATVAWAA
jgi:hypothetical protein